MKLVMINDCAFVGETLLKYLPPKLEKQHIQRGRNFWNKTFGLAFNILKAKGDIYHVNYLLQDCYIASLLGKRPLIGHAHGSDLRASLNHGVWGRIVKHNLKHCDKILVSTPDILGIARKYREDAEYLPNPVDTKLFYPKPKVQESKKKRILIASDSNWKVKGTDIAIKALNRIKDAIEVSIIRQGKDFDKTYTLSTTLGLSLNILPRMPHEKLCEYYWNADIVIDQFKIGSLGMISLEAIACGRPVITFVSSEFAEYSAFPLKDVNNEAEIIDAVNAPLQKLWKEEYAYLLMYHKPEKIAKKIQLVYNNLV